MSGPSKGVSETIHSKQQLVEWFEKACTPKQDLLIGMEHEKPPFYKNNNDPVTYDGTKGRAGVRDFLNAMVTEKGWQAGTIEKGNLTDISQGRANWTLEPAMQLETGGAPLQNIHQIAQETTTVIKDAADAASDLGFRMVATGFHPTHRADTLELMKKSRYDVYRGHVASQNIEGGMDLIACTSTVQANFGFTSEKDAVDKIRASINVAPAVIAMFATSPFADGKPSGYESTRSHVLHNGWEGRFGFMLPVAFEKDFGFEKYTDYVLQKMPMLGFYEGDTFKPAQLSKFTDFIDAKLEVCGNRAATLSDWSDLLNTVWPDTRPRKLLEMRSADVGPQEMVNALAAFWTGLLYDETSLRDTLRYTKDWSNQDREYLRAMAPETGLQTTFRNTNLGDISKELLKISEAGLQRRNQLDATGQSEAKYLEPLKEIVESGRNWSQRLLERYHGPWKGNISHLFNEMDYAKSPSVLTAPAPAPVNRKTFLPARSGK